MKVIIALMIVVVMGLAPSWQQVGGEGLSPGDSCTVMLRQAKSDDTLLRDRNPLWGTPANLNDAPGPGSLRAVVRNDSLHHPYIFIVDTRTGASRRLCSGSRPRFSPNGQWIAFSRWVSRERPWMLALVDPESGIERIIEPVQHIEDFAWSPDSKRLAFTSMSYDSTWEDLIGWIDPESGTVHVLATDTDPYVEYWGCEWAPDSRRFVVERQREYEHDHDGSIFAHDLWLFDIEGRACRLTHTPKVSENAPGWIDNRRISFEISWDETEGGGRYVLELAPGPARGGR